MKLKPSLQPQQVQPGVWYYENYGRIDLIVNIRECQPGPIDATTLHIKIPKRKLKASLRRMG